MGAADFPASLQVEAQARGETIAQAAIRRAREGVQRGGGGGLAARAWRDTPYHVRQALIAFCTDRQDVELSAHRGWADFTPDERARIGATARTWAKGLQGAGFLR